MGLMDPEFFRAVWERFGRRPGVVCHLAGVAFLVAAVAVSSNVAVSVIAFAFIVVSIGMLAGGVWLLHGIVFLYRVVTKTLGPGLRPRELAAWLFLPALTLVAVGLVATRLPFRVRFRLSEPALRAFAGGDREEGPAGLFRVRRVEEIDGRRHLVTIHLGWFDEAGLVLVEGGEEPRAAGWPISYRRHLGDWWIFRLDD